MLDLLLIVFVVSVVPTAITYVVVNYWHNRENDKARWTNRLNELKGRG